MFTTKTHVISVMKEIAEVSNDPDDKVSMKVGIKIIKRYKKLKRKVGVLMVYSLFIGIIIGYIISYFYKV